MQPSVRLHIVLSIAINLLLVQHSDAYTWNVVNKMRTKIVAMDYELVLDAFAKVQSIDELKLRESKTTAYRQGELAYHVRKKWALMRKIYFKCVAEQDKMTELQLIQEMTRLQRMSMDIYHATENMHEMEEMDTEPPTSTFRRYLLSADAAVREKRRKRNEELLKFYLSTKAPSVDIQQELDFLNKNLTVLLNQKKMADNTFELDPELLLDW